MKLAILIGLLFVGCAFAQEEEGNDTECNVGVTIYNSTSLVTDEEGENCSPLQTNCQTKVEVSPGAYRIYRQCQTPEACENNKQSNPQQCYSEEAEAKQEKVCHFCCQGNLCNDGSEIDITLPTAEV